MVILVKQTTVQVNTFYFDKILKQFIDINVNF